MLNGTIRVLLLFLFVPLLGAEPEGAFSFEEALTRLGHDEFKERVAAQEELREWGQVRVAEGIQVFYGIFRTHDDPEIRMRCRELLKDLVIISQADQGKGYIGIRMKEDLVMKPGEKPRSAVRISQVMPDTPAERAELKAGDVVIGIDDMRFDRPEATKAFGDYVQSKKPTQTVTLHLLRQGEPMKQKVELMKRPPIDERLFFPLGEEFVPPDQESVEEDEFREWLKRKVAEESLNQAGAKAAERDGEQDGVQDGVVEPLENQVKPD